MAGAQMLVAEGGADSFTRFVRGHEYLRKGMKLEARAELEILSFQNEFILADYVAYDLARLALENNDGLAAIGYLDSASAALEKSPARKDASKLRLLAACLDEAAPECGKALAETGVDMTPASFVPARMMIEAARAEKSGKPAEGYRLYMELAYRHPASQEAALATGHAGRLRAANGAKEPGSYPPPSYQDELGRALRLMDANMHEEAAARLEAMIADGPGPEREAMLRHTLGSALYKARQRERARAVFEEFARDFPDHDQRRMAEYYIAIVDWNKERNQECKDRLERLAKEGASGVRGLAYYSLGRMAETEGAYAPARSYYEYAVKAGVPQRVESDLWWRQGWVEYKLGAFAKAAELFKSGAARVARLGEDGRFLYWRARALESAGDVAQAGQVEAELNGKYPFSYYGLAGKTFGLKADPIPVSIMDTDNGVVADQPENLPEAVLWRLDRAMTLARAQLAQRAEKELDLILPEIKKEAPALAWLGSLYVKVGAPNRAMALFGAGPNGAVKVEEYDNGLWRLAYPVSHWDKISAEAAKAKMDPLLPLAVIRQESSFNERAVSRANAIGLMQIVPSTGERVFQRLNLGGKAGSPFTRESLFSPKVNIAIGVSYLSGLLARYGGAMAPALAAYNAGEPAVDVWLKRLGDAPQEEFVEMIPYSETRDYVKKVLRNLALYRSIYSSVEVSQRTQTASRPSM